MFLSKANSRKRISIISPKSEAETDNPTQHALLQRLHNYFQTRATSSQSSRSEWILKMTLCFFFFCCPEVVSH